MVRVAPIEDRGTGKTLDVAAPRDKSWREEPHAPGLNVAGPARGSFVDSAEMIRYQETGDKRALNNFCQSIKAPLHSLIKNFLCHGDSNLADDVLQEVFLRLVTTGMTFREGNAWPLLSTIARNTFIDSQRAANRRHNVSLDRMISDEPESASFMALTVSKDQGPLQLATHHDLEQRVSLAIEQLPPPQAALLRLAAREISYEQMSAQMSELEGRDVPIGTIKSRLNMARRALAEALSDDRE